MSEELRQQLDQYEAYVADLRGQLDGLRGLVRSDRDTSIRGFYRHHKGGIYFVLGIADGIDHQGAPLVVYESVQGVGEGKLQVRTLEDFTAMVEVEQAISTIDGAYPAGRTVTSVQRFTRVERWP